MACGMGKTLVGLLVARESTRAVVLVPSLSLLAQTLREWTANAERAFATSRSAQMRRCWGRTHRVDDW
jgi:predicted helicase